MIVRSKGLYEETSQRHNLPIDLIESVGNCVFEALVYKLNHPEDLAYELPKFGTFNIRFKMFDRYYENFQKLLDVNDPEAIKKRDSNLDLYKRTTSIYNKIQEFRSKKKETRTKRYAESKDHSA
jgi:hypothetical protein